MRLPSSDPLSSPACSTKLESGEGTPLFVMEADRVPALTNPKLDNASAPVIDRPILADVLNCATYHDGEVVSNSFPVSPPTAPGCDLGEENMSVGTQVEKPRYVIIPLY